MKININIRKTVYDANNFPKLENAGTSVTQNNLTSFLKAKWQCGKRF